MAGKVDKQAVSEAYEDVRNDATETSWALFGYQDKMIVVLQTGTEYENLLENFTEDDRCFAFVRMTMGDEMSKRAKFSLITWCGLNVSVMKKANLTVDRSSVKDVVSSYAIDLFTSDKNEISESKLRILLEKAGGANYGSAK